MKEHQRGQAFPLLLLAAALILAAGFFAFTLGRVQLGSAQAQSAADLSALSAARGLRTHLGDLALADSSQADAWRRRLMDEAASTVAEGMDARVERLTFPDASWPPFSVQVEVSRAGPMGTRVKAIARAGMIFPTLMDEGQTGWASGGGYSGPLVYRDGKPLCPTVAAAFDLMDAAANASGVDLIINSAFRSDAEQAILFARHPDPKWVAPPGRSRHREATELDINMNAGGSAHAWLRANGARFGFEQRYSWEPWHWGYLPGCGAGGNGRAAPAAGGGSALPGWVPDRYRGTILSAGLANGVNPTLLAALLRAESGFDPQAVSPAGAQGIAQFIPATARGLGLRDPFDPAQAIPAAARLLAGHQRDFGSIPLALAAYNAGAGAVRRYGGVPPYAETQAYVAQIIALAGGATALSGTLEGGVKLLRVEGRSV